MSNKRKLKLTLPPPGLRGDYEGTCIACFKGTDTALAFKGNAEWLTAGLVTLGIPMDQAVATVEQELPSLKTLDTDRFEMTVQVCCECAPLNFPRPVLVTQGAAIPCVGQ